MTIEDTIEMYVQKSPKLAFLKSPQFKMLSREKQEFFLGCVEDAIFWVDLEKQPNPNDGFKFLAAAYGLDHAQHEAKAKGLEGKEKEKFIRPHQDLFTVYNPYSGNGRDA